MRHAVPRSLPHIFADFPVSKYLYRTEEDPPDKAYKAYMESTREKRLQLQKIGGARLAAFEKKDEQVRPATEPKSTQHDPHAYPPSCAQIPILSHGEQTRASAHVALASKG